MADDKSGYMALPKPKSRTTYLKESDMARHSPAPRVRPQSPRLQEQSVYLPVNRGAPVSSTPVKQSIPKQPKSVYMATEKGVRPSSTGTKQQSSVYLSPFKAPTQVSKHQREPATSEQPGSVYLSADKSANRGVVQQTAPRHSVTGKKQSDSVYMSAPKPGGAPTKGSDSGDSSAYMAPKHNLRPPSASRPSSKPPIARPQPQQPKEGSVYLGNIKSVHPPQLFKKETPAFVDNYFVPRETEKKGEPCVCKCPCCKHANPHRAPPVDPTVGHSPMPGKEPLVKPERTPDRPSQKIRIVCRPDSNRTQSQPDAQPQKPKKVALFAGKTVTATQGADGTAQQDKETSQRTQLSGRDESTKQPEKPKAEMKARRKEKAGEPTDHEIDTEELDSTQECDQK